MSKRVLISVVLPTYNRARLLARSIQSVLCQSHTNLELIVVDDGSTDDTPHIVAACNDPRVRYASHSVNKGAAAARNTGIHIARGDYIAFQDSDDVWRQDKLSAQLRALERTGCAVCVCSRRLLGARIVREEVFSDGQLSGDAVIDYLFKGSSISTQTIVVLTSALREAGGFDESLEVSEDYELCLRLAQRQSFVFVSRTLVDMHESPDSISRDPNRFADATERLISKHRDIFDKHQRAQSLLMFKAAKYFGYANDYEKSRQYVRRALKADPLNRNALVLYLGLLTHTVPILRRLRP